MNWTLSEVNVKVSSGRYSVILNRSGQLYYKLYKIAKDAISEVNILNESTLPWSSTL